ncbi:unnamed protein product, partial [Closterium sp. NIES-54]
MRPALYLFAPPAPRPLGPTSETDARPRTCPAPGPVPAQRPALYLPNIRPCTCPVPGPVPAQCPALSFFGPSAPCLALRPLGPPPAPCLAPRPLGHSAPPQRPVPGPPAPCLTPRPPRPLGPPRPPRPLVWHVGPLGPSAPLGRPCTWPTPGPVPAQRPAPFLAMAPSPLAMAPRDLPPLTAAPVPCCAM